MKIQRETERQPFMALIRRHCVPLHVVAKDGSPHAKAKGELKFTGGSALLWESMEGRFLVTAFHVWRELIDRVERPFSKYRLFTYDFDGPVLIHRPTLVDASDDLDLAVFTVRGIRDFIPRGKSFLQTLSWPCSPAQPGEMLVGCGYPGDLRIFRDGHWHLQIMFWAFKECIISKTGMRLFLTSRSGKGLVPYFTRSKPKALGLPGISGAPVFALRDTVDWVGVVRSGSGTVRDGYSIQATPSGLIGPSGNILKA